MDFDIGARQQQHEPTGNSLPTSEVVRTLSILEKRLTHPALSPLSASSRIERHLRTAFVSAFHSFKLLALGFLPESLQPLTLALANLQALSTLPPALNDSATTQQLSVLNNLTAQISAHPIHEVTRLFTLGDFGIFERFGTQCDEASKKILEILQHITTDITGPV